MSTPYKLNVGSWMSHKPITVKSSIDLPLKVFGKEFWLSSSTGLLYLRMNDTDEKIPIPVGFRFRLPGDDMFESLTFSQETGVDITAEFYYGTAFFGYTIHP